MSKVLGLVKACFVQHTAAKWRWEGGGGLQGGGGGGTEEGTEGGRLGTLTTLGRAPTCTVLSRATDDFKTMPPSPLSYLRQP